MKNKTVKIIGQVQAIDRMVDEDVPCEDVLAQITLPAEQKKRISELRWAVLEVILRWMQQILRWWMMK